MIKSLNTWKKIAIYGFVLFFIFTFSLILLVVYNLYVQSINSGKNHRNQKEGVNSLACEENNKIKLVQRVDQLKIGYKVGNEENPHIFLIDVLKIDGCKYIMVHNHIEGDTDLALIHAESCTNCKERK